MSLLDRFRRGRPRPGDEWTGPRAWSTDFPDVVPCAGFYALADDGQALRRPLVRLMQVDLAPGDLEDGSEIFLVAGPHDRPQIAGDRLVNVELVAKGRGSAF